MAKKAIPDEVKQQATQIIERFNHKELARTGSYYSARWQGAFLYLERVEHGTPAHRSLGARIRRRKGRAWSGCAGLAKSDPPATPKVRKFTTPNSL